MSPLDPQAASATTSAPSHDTRAWLALSNPYRQEWDGFAKALGVDPRDRQNIALIKDAIRIYNDMVMQATQRGVSLSPTAKSDAVTQARTSWLALPPFGQKQANVPNESEQAPRVSNRAQLNAARRLPGSNHRGPTASAGPSPSPSPSLGNVLNPSRSAYAVQYNDTPTSGRGVSPVGTLSYALDLAMLDARYTPNLPDGRTGRGEPYRDADGSVFYRTFDANGASAGLVTLSAGSALPLASRLAAGAPLLASGILAAELRSGNPILTGAALLTIGSSTLYLGTSGRLPPNQGYGEGKQPQVTGPIINLPTTPTPALGGYTPLSEEERERMSRPVTTPIPAAASNWMTIYPPADPLVIQDLIMMSESYQSSSVEDEYLGNRAGVGGNIGKLIGSTNGLEKAEVDFIYERVASGRTVEIVPSSNAGRSADFLIDGVKVELKTMSNVINQTSDGLSKALSSTIMDARGQSGNVTIDARGKAGMTPEIALRGINRAFSADTAKGAKIETITIITAQGTIFAPRLPAGSP